MVMISFKFLSVSNLLLEVTQVLEKFGRIQMNRIKTSKPTGGAFNSWYLSINSFNS